MPDCFMAALILWERLFSYKLNLLNADETKIDGTSGDFYNKSRLIILEGEPVMKVMIISSGPREEGALWPVCQGCSGGGIEKVNLPFLMQSDEDVAWPLPCIWIMRIPPQKATNAMRSAANMRNRLRLFWRVGWRFFRKLRHPLCCRIWWYDDGVLRYEQYGTEEETCYEKCNDFDWGGADWYGYCPTNGIRNENCDRG